VKTELLADSLSKNFNMEVTTVNGVVSLNGKVKNSESIMLVQGIANSVDGVRDVNVSGLTLEENKGY
jgi:hyperosmotically inducible periplasmic protein